MRKFNLTRARSFVLFLLLTLTVTSCGSAAVVDATEPSRGLLAYWDLLWGYLEATGPAIFFAAMVLLPIGPIPLSAFYLLGPILYGLGPFMAGTAIALVFNMSIAYWVASGALRPLVEKLFARLGRGVPELKIHRASHVIIIVRVTPGIPYFIQNLSLGLAGVPFRSYLLISWPIQMGWALAFGVLGESLVEGESGLVIAVLGLIVALLVVTRLTRGRADRDK